MSCVRQTDCADAHGGTSLYCKFGADAGEEEDGRCILAEETGAWCAAGMQECGKKTEYTT